MCAFALYWSVQALRGNGGVGSTAEKCPSPHLGLLDDVRRETETGCQHSVALDLHDDIVDDLIQGLAMGDQCQEDTEEGGRHGGAHDKQCLGYHGQSTLPDIRHVTGVAVR